MGERENRGERCVSKYGHLDKGELLRLLERRDAERQLGLVCELKGAWLIKFDTRQGSASRLSSLTSYVPFLH